jgi:allantoinase
MAPLPLRAPTLSIHSCGLDDRVLDLLIRAERVVTGGRVEPRAIGVRDGVIAAILPVDAAAVAAEEITIAADAVVLPGLVDTHVHVCEPGNTAWEGFATATAAAAGGITTLVDMPIDSVPATVDPDALAVKRHATQGQLHVDVGFWGGVTPTSLGWMEALLDAGVVGFKCFLVGSGAEDFLPVDDDSLELALAVTARTGVPLMVHAEDLSGVPAPVPSRRYADWLAARPPATEDHAVARVLDATRRTGGRAHIAHLSSATALPMLEAARADGVAVTAETCPHYLLLSAEEIGDGDTAAKCGPPIRDAANRAALWEGLAAGVLDAVVSDHSPCLPQMKSLDTGDFSTAWGGISSLQVALPAAWTAARARGFRLTDLARWMAEAPADLAGLATKGRIVVGADADLCVLAPEETFVVDPSRLLHRHLVCPYVGKELVGTVRATMLRGHWVDAEGAPLGRLVRRSAA